MPLVHPGAQPANVTIEEAVYQCMFTRRTDPKHLQLIEVLTKEAKWPNQQP